METLKRYLIFLVGLFVNSLGVSLITKANLGTSPISSIPSIAATLFLTSAISVSSLQSNKLKSSVFQNCTFLNQKPCPCFSLFLPVTHLFFFQSILYKSCMCLICIQKKPYNITANDMSLKYDFQIDCSLRVYIIYNKYYKALYIFTISQHCGCNSQ